MPSDSSPLSTTNKKTPQQPNNNPNPQHSETHKRQARDSRRKRIVLGYFDRPGRWMDRFIHTQTGECKEEDDDDDEEEHG
jgi:hypothetical protein